jgi:hypothetical protein
LFNGYLTRPIAKYNVIKPFVAPEANGLSGGKNGDCIEGRNQPAIYLNVVGLDCRNGR